MTISKEDVLAREISNALLNAGKEFSGKEIIQIISQYIEADDSTIYALLGAGIISVAEAKTKIGNYIFSTDRNKAKDIKLLKSLIFGGQRRRDMPIFEVVASYPSHGSYGGFNKIVGIESLYPMLCRLIIKADKQILMANPFFDKLGVEKVLPYIKKAVERGVKIKIVSRSPRGGSAKSWRGIEDEIKEIGENCKVRHFGGTIGGKRFYLHAKFMVADEKMAYVGSANITETSLGNNVEVGVIFTGEKVKHLIDFFNVIWKHSN